MKRCPQCNRVDADDTLTFCRVDGTPLVRQYGASGEETGTLRFGSAPISGESETPIPPTREDITRTIAPTTVLDERRVSRDTGSGKLKFRGRVVLAAVAIVALALGSAGYYFYLSPIKMAAAKNSIAVLPFVNASGDPNMEYLSDGITESLINSLSQLPNLAVKARSTVFRYKGKEADTQKVGSELGVQAILNGHVAQRGDDLMLSLELVDATTGDQIWGERYNRKVTDLVALQGEIARDVSNKLRVKLSGADEQRLAKNYTENAEAYQLYLKGRFHWNRRTRKDIERSLEYFQQAIAMDPNYALPYVGIAEVFMTQQLFPTQTHETMSKARENAQKALTLDRNSAEAHTALGRILSAYDYDFAAAEREYLRAIELNPNYANGHYWYGQLCMVQARWEEAFAEYRRALELEPLSLIINTNYASLLSNARRYDEAIAHLKKTLELDDNFIATHGNLANAYWLKGDYAKSVESRTREREVNGEHEVAGLMRNSFAKGGWEGYLRYMAEDRRAARSFYFVALLYAALGEKDKAFIALNKSYENREAALQLLKVDPRVDPLRSDPRYADLIRKVGLPQ